MLKQQPNISTIETGQNIEIFSSAQFMTEQQKDLRDWIVSITNAQPETIQRQIEEGRVFVSKQGDYFVGFVRLALHRDYCIVSSYGEGIGKLLTAAQERFPNKVMYFK